MPLSSEWPKATGKNLVGKEAAGGDISLPAVIDLALELINPVTEPGEVLPNVICINPVLVGELRDHHVVGVESTLHHPLALEDFAPLLRASSPHFRYS
ncbi:hypothetical protein D1007_40415 [Hordeum vulgare]|nr:hypothetical protein D1007_40415 [Hordeum vulgare]